MEISPRLYPMYIGPLPDPFLFCSVMMVVSAVIAQQEQENLALTIVGEC